MHLASLLRYCRLMRILDKNERDMITLTSVLGICIEAYCN